MNFIHCFPEIQFYKQTLGGIVPSWLTQKAGVLQGIMRNQQIWVKFDAFDYLMPHITVQDIWYRLTLQGMVDDTHPKVFLENKQAYFVGVEMEYYKTMLAIMLEEEDKKVIGTSIYERERGKHELFISEITTEEKIQLIHAVNEGEKVLVEKIPWV